MIFELLLDPEEADYSVENKSFFDDCRTLNDSMVKCEVVQFSLVRHYSIFSFESPHNKNLHHINDQMVELGIFRNFYNSSFKFVIGIKFLFTFGSYEIF